MRALFFLAALVVGCSGEGGAPVFSGNDDAGATDARADASIAADAPAAHDAIAADAPAPPSSDAGSDSAQAADSAPPGCADACAKAYACKMVSDPNGCVCSGKSASADCITCWLTHSCDELKNFACYGACN